MRGMESRKGGEVDGEWEKGGGGAQEEPLS